MTRTNRLLALPIVALGILLVLGAGLRLYMGRAAEDRVEEGEIVDFASLTPPAKPNRFLMCPKGICNTPADATSPVFDMEWERLRDCWSEMVAHQKRLKLVAGDGELSKITYVQHSALFHFPDVITIEFFPLPGGRSTFALDSRSRYGYSDMGVNRRRVLDWVGQLEHAVDGLREQ